MMSADQDMMSTIADAGMAEADVSPMVDSTVMPCEWRRATNLRGWRLH